MRINLLPEEHRPSRSVPFAFALVLALAVLFSPLGYYTYQLSASIGEQEMLEKTLSERHLSLGEIAGLVRERDELNQSLAAAAMAAGPRQQFHVTEHISELSRLLPSAVVLTEFTLTRDTLSVRGTSTDIGSMVNFLGALVASPYFGESPNLSHLIGAGGDYGFSMTVAVRMGAEAR